MTEPFALRHARPAAPDPSVPYTYDPELQLNVLPDGTPAAEDHAVLRSLGTTTSTAGSKTHFDD
ncbi:putative ATP-grasp-modified RiPP [Streptomyces sp. NPDC017936]|uniref:putative ATP-grasp-modified RiPP n=1 Tax=Streptomyces sp. NPDC017936 TaxID=3365016 RepID=UPI0037B4FC5A